MFWVIKMKSKNIIFTEPNVAKLIEQEVSLPKENEILVKLCVSSISSGTERANLMGSKTIAWNRPDEAQAVFPRQCGYSSAGVVMQVGNAVTKFKVGDRVATWWGTHSEYITISENNACLIDDVSFEDAALLHIATFPLAAIRKCRLEIGESAIVMGMGILGIVALQLLKAAGAVPIIAVDPDPKKRQKALESGADYALDPFDENFIKNAKELTCGGAKVGIEVTGVGAGLNGILDVMARFGRVALLGCTRSSDFEVDYYHKVHGPGISIIGAHTAARPEVESYSGYWTQQDDMFALKKLVKEQRIQLSKLVDQTYSPCDAEYVYNKLISDKTFPVVQFNWRQLK